MDEFNGVVDTMLIPMAARIYVSERLPEYFYKVCDDGGRTIIRRLRRLSRAIPLPTKSPPSQCGKFSAPMRCARAS